MFGRHTHDPPSWNIQCLEHMQVFRKKEKPSLISYRQVMSRVTREKDDRPEKVAFNLGLIINELTWDSIYSAFPQPTPPVAQWDDALSLHLYE